jgi:hypothetical protein
MSTRTFLPVGNKSELVSKGDVIELITGEKMTFVEMKRSKWVGKNSAGKLYNIPVYANRMGNTAYAKAIVGRDESVIVKSAPVENFKRGQLFAIENAKETFMFKELVGRKVVALDLATGRTWRIGTECTFSTVDVNEVMSKL